MTTYLPIVAGEIEVMERVMSRSIDNVFQRMASNHVGVVDLNMGQH